MSKHLVTIAIVSIVAIATSSAFIARADDICVTGSPAGDACVPTTPPGMGGEPGPQGPPGPAGPPGPSPIMAFAKSPAETGISSTSCTPLMTATLEATGPGTVVVEYSVTSSVPGSWTVVYSASTLGCADAATPIARAIMTNPRNTGDDLPATVAGLGYLNIDSAGTQSVTVSGTLIPKGGTGSVSTVVWSGTLVASFVPS